MTFQRLKTITVQHILYVFINRSWQEGMIFVYIYHKRALTDSFLKRVLVLGHERLCTFDRTDENQEVSK